jgi:O-acetyl-ADP-ribose deacetylase (regulator of RNase III)
MAFTAPAVGEPQLLANCYHESLRLARENGVGSIAFPAISCGVYGYPLNAAATIAVREVRSGVAAHALPGRIVFCCFGASIANFFRRALDTGTG